MRRSGSLVPLLLALIAGCGSPPEPSSPEAAAPSEASAEPGSDPGASAAPSDAAASPSDAAAAEGSAPAGGSETESLARDFVKKPGRRIGWSATKKLFAYPVEQRREDGFRLDIFFAGDDGRQRDVMQFCDFSECAERLDELAKELLPKLVAKLDDGGYVAIKGIGWPSGRNELDVSSLGMKLKYANGKMEGIREGKPNVSLGSIPKSPEVLAIFIVPDTKHLAVFAKPTGNTKATQEFHVLKLP